ncbi:hypothetical protein [Actinomadura opuntiae]|uniref:hypothetical protein n=1 Tax=Actinomadura sp. OS1-43 TaxID=604315 RepID=UPI00255AC35B|nr:hypothetical protein [Actinomadura sp. OS1-43]MDL4819324.1 hypothetical protein [Actinomadura sp. OS1-43]
MADGRVIALPSSPAIALTGARAPSDPTDPLDPHHRPDPTERHRVAFERALRRRPEPDF